MKHKRLPVTQTEPAVTRGVVVAVLTVLASLGFSWAAHVDKQTIATIATVASVVVPVLQGLWTRYAVTANAKVISRVTTDGTVVAGDAALLPTGSRIPVTYPTTSGGAVVPGLPTATAQVHPEVLQGP